MSAYGELDQVDSFIRDLADDVLEHIPLFRLPEEEPEAPEESRSPQGRFRRYRVNVLVDNSDLNGTPVVKPSPTYHQLFGRGEREVRQGALDTDFSLLRPGSMHRANGGYLVLPAAEVLRNSFVWDGLKHALQSSRLDIDELGEQRGAALPGARWDLNRSLWT